MKREKVIEQLWREYFAKKAGRVGLPRVNHSSSNLENILCMLHEFRNWNRDWDIYFTKHPKNIDEFAQLLSKRYRVERV